MGQRATLNYTPALVRRSVWAYWKRTVGITWPLVLVLLTGYVLLIVREGQTGWTVGVFGTIVTMGYVFMALVYLSHLRHGMTTLRAMGTPQGTLDIDDAGLTVSSGAARATLPWRSVQRVWRCPDFWLLLLSPSQYITLPLDDLPEAMRTEILARLQQHGGRVD